MTIPFLFFRKETAFALTIAAFACVVLIALVNQRTFIPDEAWFAENLVTRPFSRLFAKPFINEQTAPALYSLITKACGALFGYSQFGLRLPSSLAWLGVLTVALTLLRSSFGLTKLWTTGGIALLASMPVVLRYGTELKPYIFDVLCVLVVILMKTKYDTKKILSSTLALAFCLCLLFSTAAFFFVAGTLATAFIGSVLKRQKDDLLRWFTVGVTVLAFATFYYVLWLMPVAESSGMQTFWNGRSFLRLGSFETAACLFGGSLLLLPSAAIGWIAGLRRKDGFSACVAASVLLALAASSVGKYPVSDRLWLFLRVVALLYSVSGTRIAWIFLFSGFSAAVRAPTLRVAAAFLCLSLPLALFARNVFVIATEPSKIGIVASKTWDYNPLTAWLRANAVGERVYVSAQAKIIIRSRFRFADESTIRFGDLSKPIIWGTADDRSRRWATEEADKIRTLEHCYLVLNSEYDAELVDALKRLGSVYELGRVNETPLLYFSVVLNDPNLRKEVLFR